uniref:PNPLA domain-containing protein n=1 Tax=Wuchereria bancrofti TaxID=6293 RepID=A0A1I8E903_WUCBA
MSTSGVRIVNANRERVYKASLSLSGCGFLSIYHAGVCAAIKEYAPQLLQNRISGASAGSIIAAGVICNVCISRAASFFLSVVSEVRSYTFGVLNRDFDLMKMVRTKLNAILPANAHELCTGRLRISVTRFRDMENVILDEFCTKDELIDAICCSCFIPIYGGFVYPTFRGEIYIDGGASDNQPVINTDTITVSPFSGESDICPTDEESASLFEWNFAGTSIRLTANNLYRAALCLFPPSAEECTSMCRSGFNDALKFLVDNGFTSNAICISVEVDLLTNFNQISETVAVDTTVPSNSAICKKSYENEKIAGYIDAVLATEATQLPHSIQNGSSSFTFFFIELIFKKKEHMSCEEISALMETMKKNWFLDYIRSFRVIHLSTWLTVRITRHMTEDWLSVKVKHILDFILNEIHVQEAKVSARLSQQLAITEVHFYGTNQQCVVQEQLNVNLSWEAIKEKEVLGSMDRLLSKTTLSYVKGSSDIAVKDIIFCKKITDLKQPQSECLIIKLIFIYASEKRD